MNKIALAVLALAAFSTAALAERTRSYELRDIQPFKGGAASVTTERAPLAVAQDVGSLTNFQRLTMISLENSAHSRH